MRDRLAILLFEDALAEANVLKHGLLSVSSPNADVTHARDVREAMSMLDSDRVDAALLALASPAAEGLANVRALSDHAPDVPIIALSADDDREVEAAAIQAGAQVVIPKGALEARTLARLLEQIVDRRELDAANQTYVRELAAMHAQFRRMIADSADAMLVLDNAGMARFINPAGEALFGRPARDLLNSSVDLPLDTGRTAEVNIVRPGGLDVVADLCVTPTLWEGERMLLATLRDVTQRKALELDLQEEARNANAAAEAKAAFLANMSHELRTPLNCILGYIDLIRSELYGPLSNEKYHEYLDIAGNAGEELLEMIGNVLELAQADADSISLHETEFRFDVAARECLATASPLLRKAALNVETDLSEATVLGDEKRYKQVLMNLISNAAKFTEPGGKVAISTEAMECGGLAVNVRDTGVGIDREDLPRLFAKFERTADKPYDPKVGAGLGLSLCKQFTELHGGQIRVKSVKGVGSIFTFTIPTERVLSAERLTQPVPEELGLRRMSG